MWALLSWTSHNQANFTRAQFFRQAATFNAGRERNVCSREHATPRCGTQYAAAASPQSNDLMELAHAPSGIVLTTPALSTHSDDLQCINQGLAALHLQDGSRVEDQCRERRCRWRGRFVVLSLGFVFSDLLRVQSPLSCLCMSRDSLLRPCTH